MSIIQTGKQGVTEPDTLFDCFTIRVRALPRPVPAAVRVRAFLKAALRAYGLKCTAIGGPEEGWRGEARNATGRGMTG
jgi:hypothetical protein